MKEYEKLIAYALTLGAVLWIAWMIHGDQGFVMVDGKPVSVQGGSGLRDVLIGMVAVLSAGGQALFRTSEMAAAMNALLSNAMDKLSNSTPAVTSAPADAKEAASDVAGAAQDKANQITGDVQ